MKPGIVTLSLIHFFSFCSAQQEIDYIRIYQNTSNDWLEYPVSIIKLDSNQVALVSGAHNGPSNVGKVIERFRKIQPLDGQQLSNIDFSPNIQMHVGITASENLSGAIFSTGGYDSYSPPPTEDYYISKRHNDGNLSWFRSYDGLNKERGEAITCDTFQNIYVVGSVFKVGKSSTTFIAKHDSIGNQIWNIEIDSLVGDILGRGIAIDNQAEHIYALCQYDLLWPTTHRGHLFKIDALTGQILWQKELQYGSYMHAMDLKLTGDNNLVASLGIRYDSLQNKSVPAIAKMDTSGNTIWVRDYYTYLGNKFSRGNKLTLTRSGGFAMCISVSYDGKTAPVLLVTDSKGLPIFHTVFKDLNIGYPQKVLELPDTTFMSVGISLENTNRSWLIKTKKQEIVRVNENSTDLQNKLRIFPNPVTSFLRVNAIVSSYETFDYRVLAIDGTIEKSGIITGASKSIFVGDLSPGNYFLEISKNQNMKQFCKFIKV